MRWREQAARLVGLQDIAPYEVETEGISAGRLDLRDAVRIARKAAELDPNP